MFGVISLIAITISFVFPFISLAFLCRSWQSDNWIPHLRWDLAGQRTSQWFSSWERNYVTLVRTGVDMQTVRSNLHLLLETIETTVGLEGGVEPS